MVFKIKVSTQAQLDIWEGIDWYESKQHGLGQKFNNELNKLLYELGKHPSFYSFYKKDFRRAILRTSPYLVVFKIIEDEVIVYAIIYGGRNPELLNKRIS